MGILGVLDFKEHTPTGRGLGSQGWLEESKWVQEGPYGSFGGLGFQGTPPFGLGWGSQDILEGVPVDLGGIL